MQLTLWVRTAETRARIEAEMTRDQIRSAKKRSECFEYQYTKAQQLLRFFHRAQKVLHFSSNQLPNNQKPHEIH